MTDREADHDGQRSDGLPRARTPSEPIQRAGVGSPFPRAGKRADPTEPEVPSAKRVRATRRQRSLWFVGFAIGALLSIALFLLYKTGRHVTTMPAAAGAFAPQGAPVAREALGPPAATAAEAVPTATASIVAAPVVSGAASPSAAPAPVAPRPKSSGASTDIFRKPVF